MSLPERATEWCPFGCGQPTLRHSDDVPCPPQDNKGNWLNSPSIALGATPQLHQDVRALTEFKNTVGCANCRTVIQSRINVIQQELGRRSG